ncbi:MULTISPECIES: hypothetical protein [Pseudomonas]|uniref:hypothetical protein n=1 Tax=Pseudomonas TaxID=286 RepID=UPI0007B35728|nr:MULTISPECIES: hypothetical protein [Pseudomonas]AZC51338.1 hypothetical protein C4K35_3757 [Pseudomonas chlororaphis subsp. piscium]AZC57909.1 hypothetical protein C4K34_3746 [Pseudomonas chlororaphis subsp. piscium]AZC64141.1 hypothetical protein C4K33_3651 [Pseudomonas chlororaphis subsp. piscium]AZC70364.1 hypothetical protein C4K32_3704 [Pseudomonas chlororaphis subsp. piscium]AZC76631.1 hypothetical protein C4K31_3730 [Pseudomonas chlororaphis subsp. piscium]
MSVFLVTWNLNKERSNYDQARQAFIQHLERYQNVKDPGLESVRWISSNATAAQIDEDLRLKLDSNDRIFITKLNNREYQGWLNKDVWTWIDTRL